MLCVIPHVRGHFGRTTPVLFLSLEVYCRQRFVSSFLMCFGFFAALRNQRLRGAGGGGGDAELDLARSGRGGA